jgi:hypothetical protein
VRIFAAIGFTPFEFVSEYDSCFQRVAEECLGIPKGDLKLRVSTKGTTDG